MIRTILAAHVHTGVDHWHVAVLTLTWLAGLGTILFSLLDGRISRWRKPLYLLAIPVVLIFFAIYLNSFMDAQWHVSFMTEATAGLWLRIVLFGVAISFFLIPYVDRLEHKTANALKVIRSDTEETTMQLITDQQSTMDEQHAVMGEQRIVMEEQRKGSGKDEH